VTGTLTNIEHIIGTNYADTMVNNAFSNIFEVGYILEGGGGNDFLYGRCAVNELYGGDGNDTFQMYTGSVEHVFGGAGVDRVSYSTAVAGVTVDANGTTGDTFSGIENYLLTTGNDTFTGTGADETIYGGLGADRIDGRGGNDSIFCGNADKSADVSADTVVLQLGSGTDRIYGFTVGQDHIDLTALASTGVHSLADLRSNFQAGFGYIQHGSDLTLITTTGVGILTAASFIFA
jgi:Ca2+-binding RTX toxin-like protein